MKIKKIKLIYFIVLLFVVLLSIGYSAFNVSLNIEDILAYVRIKRDIRITGFNINNASDGAISDYEEYNYDKVSSSVTLPESNSYITYRLDITNFEVAEMGIYEIKGLSDNLEYSISNYELKDKICDSANKCNLGITKDIYITIKYKTDGYDESNTKYNINLDIIFKEIYDVTYSGITNNGYQEYIMAEEILEVKFTEFIPYNVVPYVDGMKLDYDKYTYEDGVLTVNEVLGNIVVEYIEKVYLITLGEGTYFKEEEHIEKIKTISFVDYIEVPSDNLATYDLSKNKDKTIIGWIDKDYNLYIGSDFHIYGEGLSDAFKGMTVTEKITFNNLNTSEVTNMGGMFYKTGYDVSTFKIIGLDEFDMSSVTNLFAMFRETGYNATEWDIGDLSKWDTSNVTDMTHMFQETGLNATTWYIGDLSDWDVSNVTGMAGMFQQIGQSADVVNIGNLDNWDVSSVKDMGYMFYGICNMGKTFCNIGDLSKWNTSSVTNMYAMFSWAGSYIENDDVRISVGDLSKWDTSKVTDMRDMFAYTRFKSTYKLDLSNWKVPLVTDYTSFNEAVEDKVISPVWVN